jgi:hypothetical protein
MPSLFVTEALGEGVARDGLPGACSRDGECLPHVRGGLVPDFAEARFCPGGALGDGLLRRGLAMLGGMAPRPRPQLEPLTFTVAPDVAAKIEEARTEVESGEVRALTADELRRWAELGEWSDE